MSVVWRTRHEKNSRRGIVPGTRRGFRERVRFVFVGLLHVFQALRRRRRLRGALYVAGHGRVPFVSVTALGRLVAQHTVAFRRLFSYTQTRARAINFRYRFSFRFIYRRANSKSPSSTTAAYGTRQPPASRRFLVSSALW